MKGELIFLTIFFILILYMIILNACLNEQIARIHCNRLFRNLGIEPIYSLNDETQIMMNIVECPKIETCIYADNDDVICNEEPHNCPLNKNYIDVKGCTLDILDKDGNKRRLNNS